MKALVKYLFWSFNSVVGNVLLLATCSTYCHAQVFGTNTIVASIDITGDGEAEIMYMVTGGYSLTEPLSNFGRLYGNSKFLESSEQITFLSALPKRTNFVDGEIIGPKSKQHVYFRVPREPSYRPYYLETFYWQRGNWQPSYSPENGFSSETNLICGFGYSTPLGTQYGWLRLVRTQRIGKTTVLELDPNDLSLYSPVEVTNGPVGFTLDSWNVHPIPGESIRAGFPPEGPSFSFRIEAANENHPVRTVISWRGLWTTMGYGLEATASLSQPIEWRPVDAIETVGDISEYKFPANSENAYFRIRAP